MPRFTVMRLLQITAALSIVLAVLCNSPPDVRAVLLLIPLVVLASTILFAAVVATAVTVIAAFYYPIVLLHYLFGKAIVR